MAESVKNRQNDDESMVACVFSKKYESNSVCKHQ